MMYDKDKLLLKIANAIVANIGNITRNGLLDGKTGVPFSCICLHVIVV